MKLNLISKILLGLCFVFALLYWNEYHLNKSQKKQEIKQAEENIEASEEKVEDLEKEDNELLDKVEESEAIKNKAYRDGKEVKNRIDTISDVNALYNEVARHYRR